MRWGAAGWGAEQRCRRGLGLGSAQRGSLVGSRAGEPERVRSAAPLLDRDEHKASFWSFGPIPLSASVAGVGVVVAAESKVRLAAGRACHVQGLSRVAVKAVLREGW